MAWGLVGRGGREAVDGDHRARALQRPTGEVAVREVLHRVGTQEDEDVKLAVPGSMVRFAEVHPKDDAEVVEQIKGVFAALEESRTVAAA